MDQRKLMLFLIFKQWHLEMMSVAILMVLLKLDFAQQQYKRNMLRRRTFANNQTRLFYLDSLIGSSNINYVNQLRMDRRTFGILCELLRTDDKLKKDGLVTIEEQVCSFLHVLAHHVKNCTIGHRFNRSGETVSRYFNSVLNGIIRLQGSLLQKPNPIPNDCTDARWKWFKGCLGALDETHIKVRVSEKDKPRYRTRKCEVATNVLGVCSRDMKFIFVFPGWEGSASDSRVLRDALSRPTGLKVPNEGARCDTGSFKSGTLTQIEKILNSILPNSGIKASPHIDSKIRFWKKQYDRATGQVVGTPQQILDEVNSEGTNMEGVGSPMLVPQQASDSIHLVNDELSRPRKRARRDTLTPVRFKEVENVIQNVFQQSCNKMKELAASVFGHNEDMSDIADELATMGLELDDELDALTLILEKSSNISAFKSLKGARR
ncbi:hypothetical protein EZV62_002715 [Acer yangbiense]|uniref:Uncharacterized protein n=1 Tax=Acer yangbiense TaxID=1000413 RepID=A0A5C7J0G5_9ROSI|nr:hypothetical protein EZV62_002715 [Acer yangbiense]